MLFNTDMIYFVRELYQSKWQSCVDHQTEGCDGDVKGQVVSAIDHIRQHMDPYCKEGRSKVKVSFDGYDPYCREGRM